MNHRVLHGPAVLLGLTLAVGGSASAALILLNHFTQTYVEVRFALRELELHVHRLNGLEWEAIAKREIEPEAAEQLEERFRQIDEVFERLSRRGFDGPSLQEIKRKYSVYKVALVEEIDLIQAEKLEEARAQDEVDVDPAFTMLNEATKEKSAAYGRKTAQVIWVSNGIAAALPLLAGLGIALLIGRLETLRREAEVAATERAVLRQSEERFRALAESATDAIFHIDEHGRILFANPSAEMTFGYTLGEMEGQEVTLLMPGCRRHLQEAVSQPDWVNGRKHRAWRAIEFLGRHKTGQEVPLEASFGEYVKNGEHFFTGIARNITERKRAEGEKVRLLAAIEQTAEAVLITDVAGRIHYVNPTFTTITGHTREEAVGQPLSILKSGPHDDTFSQKLREIIAAGRAWQGDTLNRRKDGSPFPGVMMITPVRNERGEISDYIVTLQDTTERQQLEEQFRQAQKMEAVGRLAGGVAHDFNNLLNVILGYSDLLLDAVSSDERLRGRVEEIKKAATRATSLTQQLLAFSRKQMLQLKVLDINAIVVDMDNLLRRLIGEDIELLTILEAEPWPVKADPGSMEQVILNLAVNARDAMPQGGKLTVEIKNVELGRVYTSQRKEVRPGPYVMLAVSDTGVGMDKETQTHIFEPFFTTKGKHKGTGLGLSTVYGIVKQSGGYIWVYSERGRGTTFKVYLPRVEEAVRAAGPAAPEAPPPRGTETVLLVEDEEALRALGRESLEKAGYTVLEAKDGEQALAVVDRQARPVHLLVTDVVLPKMSGRQLAEQLTARWPELKVLFVSGYTDDAIVHHGVLEAGVSFLQKPFALDKLARKVREVLELEKAH